MHIQHKYVFHVFVINSYFFCKFSLLSLQHWQNRRATMYVCVCRENGPVSGGRFPSGPLLRTCIDPFAYQVEGRGQRLIKATCHQCVTNQIKQLIYSPNKMTSSMVISEFNQIVCDMIFAWSGFSHVQQVSCNQTECCIFIVSPKGNIRPSYGAI